MKRFNIQTIIGKTYNKLTVLGEGELHLTKGGNKHRTIICKCKCGTIKTIQFSPVINGITKSCGCYSKKLASERMSMINYKHGMYNTPEYNSWVSMKKRCLNKSHKSYVRYGGRGITISNDWINSFDKFLSDMGNRPTDNHSLDRIDNNKGYYKSNCKWSTKIEQQRNKNNNIKIVYQGDKKCLSEWAEILGFSWQKLHYRLFIAKWSIDKSFNTK